MPSTERAGSIVTTVCDLDAETEFFTQELGFRVAAVFPADSPRSISLAGEALTPILILEKGSSDAPARLRLAATGERRAGDRIQSPGGTIVEFETTDRRVVVPPFHPELVLSSAEDPDAWVVGRAGMRYRDLIPGRLGGWAIASHIHVPGDGPVPDYVHYHETAFQLIYCHRGWARLVYEDQGPPFVMRAGDCVLQPPRIRHRVLESGDDLHVVEVTCPAEHATRADLEMTLPTGAHSPDRRFSGQRFAFHRLASADWSTADWPGFETRDFGFFEATEGLVRAEVLRSTTSSATIRVPASTFLFVFVLGGTTECRHVEGEPIARPWTCGASAVLPPDSGWTLDSSSEDLELLVVSAPTDLDTTSSST